MNGKMNQCYGDDASLETDLLNPFTHRLELSTTYDKIKTAIFTVVILPFRVAAICGLLIIAWWLASIGLYGLSEHELRTKPMSGWRKDTKVIVCIIMRALFAAGGFHWVTVKGKQATSKEAPVLAVAPHSSYFDALTVVYLGGPSVVAKGETGTLPIFGTTLTPGGICVNSWGDLGENNTTLTYQGIGGPIYNFLKFREYIAIVVQMTYRVGGMSIVLKGRQATRQEAPIMVIAPHSSFLDAVIVYVTGFPSIITRWESGLNPWLGKLINYTQPVYVWRDDHDSRQNTIKEIIERANSDLDWPQVLIFPEGTCTNRSCLITFKSGAFYPGVPVQPVCIRYPNKLDTVTWTWEGPGVLKLLWLTLTQVHSCCEIEFLPVYKPSIEEKKDPRLYANNVRKLMAKALGVPVSNYTYDDCRLMTRAKQMKLPCAGKLVEIQKLRQALGLTKTNEEENIIAGDDWKSLRVSQKVSYDQFTNILKIPSLDPAASHLFRLFDKESLGVIDFREYLLTVLVISKSSNLSELLYFVFKVMDEEGEGRIKENDFCTIAHRILSISTEHCSSIFHCIDKSKRGYITYNEFIDFAVTRKEFSKLFKSSNNVRNKSE